MPKSVFSLTIFPLTLMYVSFKICESVDIKLHSLISNLPPACQIKVSTIFLESENLQESNVPFEIIKLRLPNATNALLSRNISEVFTFLPRLANRCVCAINFHYFRANLWHPSNKKNYINPVNVFTHSLYVSSILIKTSFQNMMPYNIWLMNAVDLRSVVHTYPFLVPEDFVIRGAQISTYELKLPQQLLTRLAVISYSSNSQQFLFCPTVGFESILNLERNCMNASNLHSKYMSNGDSTVLEWKKKLKLSFKVYVKECTWIFYPSNSWPKIDTLNIFKSTIIDEALAHELVRKANETAANRPCRKKFTGIIHKITKSGDFVYGKVTVTSVESIKVLTCYEEPKVSFYMYMSPIEKTAWLLFFIQAVIVWLLLNLFMISKDIKTSFSPLLFIIGTMIDEANQVPRFFKNSASFKILIVSWILVSMLLSSCYQSFLVVELNSPLKSKTPSSLDETFCPVEEDLFDLKGNQGKFDERIKSLNRFWNSISTDFHNLSKLNRDYRPFILEQLHKYIKLGQAKNCFAILLFPKKNSVNWSFRWNWSWFFSGYSFLYRAIINRNLKLALGFMSPLSRHFYLLDDTNANKMMSYKFWTHLNSRKNDTLTPLTALEWEITKNEKVVIVGPDLSLANEITYLKNQYSIKHCKIFPESLDVDSVGYSFQGSIEHKLNRYFQQLVEAGIFSIAVKSENYRTFLKRVNGSRLVIKENNKGSLNMRVRSVKLNGSVQTIFELWVLLVILAVCGLIGEICVQNLSVFVFNFYFRFPQIVLQELRKFQSQLFTFM